MAMNICIAAARSGLLLFTSLVLASCVTEVRMVEPASADYQAAPAAPAPDPGENSLQPSDDVAAQAMEPPPALPEYQQPPCPGDGWLWTPGYWGYAAGGYYWVSGTWVVPPRPGLLWTPGYWAFVSGIYLFHSGYWAPDVGFYGGINYGFGYTGEGYTGGRWIGDRFAYNRSVTNVNVTVVHNSYIEHVDRDRDRFNRVSYNGGHGGITAAPSPRERQIAHTPHLVETNLQRQHMHEAAGNPALFMHANGGHPPITATSQPQPLRGSTSMPAHLAPSEGQPSGPPHFENSQRFDTAQRGNNLPPSDHTQRIDNVASKGADRGVTARSLPPSPAQPAMARTEPSPHERTAHLLPQSRGRGPLASSMPPPAARTAQPMSREVRPSVNPHATGTTNAANVPRVKPQPNDHSDKKARRSQQ